MVKEMIISHKYKFIFIKTKKTAGTSIEVYLSQHCSKDDIVTPIFPHVDPHYPRNYKGFWNPFPEITNRYIKINETFKDFKNRSKYYNHIPAIVLKERVDKRIWKSYYKFCVERNPWDKSLSHYYMSKDTKFKGMSFDDYLTNKNFCFNYPIYTNKNGKVMVDRVLKFESLNEDLGEVFNYIGIPFNGSLGVRAKSEYRKDKRHYRNVYSEMQKKIINGSFQREIKLHRYKF